MLPEWRKSSHSFANGNCVEVANFRRSVYSMSNGNCVEVGSFRKSAYSMNNGNCVEAGHGPGIIGVRDSKLGEGSPVLEFSTEAWHGMLRAIRNDVLPG